MLPLATAPRVVIAGAGPAGSAAASLLREAGAIVTVVEKAMSGASPHARSGGVVVGREAWDVLRRVGGGSLIDDSRTWLSETERILSLRRIDATLGDEAARRGAEILRGHSVDGVRELDGGAGVSVAIRDAQTGATRNLEADWFIDASGGRTKLGHPRFVRLPATGPHELLPQQREFLAVQAKGLMERPHGWMGQEGSFAINDKVDGILSAYQPITPSLAAKVRHLGIDGADGPANVAEGAALLKNVGVQSTDMFGGAWTFTASQTLAPKAAEGRILMVGDSVGTVMPVTQAGTMLALTDAERAAETIMKAHAARTADEAATVVGDYSDLTLAMHRAFIR